MIGEIIKIVKGIVSIYFLGLVIISALISIVYTGPYVKKGGYEKEAKLSKYAGISYIISGMALFIIVKLFL
jgi:hypothetical protein